MQIDRDFVEVVHRKDDAAAVRMRTQVLEAGRGVMLDRLAAGAPDVEPVAARDDQVVYGTRTGTVWQSLDAGTTWEQLADDLAPVTSLSLVP